MPNERIAKAQRANEQHILETIDRHGYWTPNLRGVTTVPIYNAKDRLQNRGEIMYDRKAANGVGGYVRCHMICCERIDFEKVQRALQAGGWRQGEIADESAWAVQLAVPVRPGHTGLQEYLQQKCRSSTIIVHTPRSKPRVVKKPAARRKAARAKAARAIRKTTVLGYYTE